ncbi:MAG: tRNA lysidine(34) synthetase TilS [Pirellulaceae bacterium]|nr:tRNA lysidine(34) synthetase TilS [Pirellulaceae bacterium]
MNLPLIEKLERRWPTDRWRNMTIVIGCSGGADSTALLLATSQLKAVGSTLIAAHYNHALRGSESDQDETFVVELARQLGCIAVTNSSLDDRESLASLSSESSNRSSDEASLRDLRYQFLRKVARRHGARYVAVAHTADDSVETTLHNLVRGTGLNGLTGIAPFRDLDTELVLVRPLVDVWRTEIIEYLQHCRQEYRQDSSNASSNYTRNRIRNRWLPLIEEDFGKDAKKSILRSNLILAELQQWLGFQARQWLENCVARTTPHRIEIVVSESVDQEWPMIQHSLVLLWKQQTWSLMPMTQEHWNRIRKFFGSPLAKAVMIELPSRIIVSREGDRWIIESKQE